jgi:proteasome assembly chaperone (PAC2) family protein
MNQTYFRVHFQPKLEEPILVVGLPGIGNIGKIVAGLLIESSHMELFAELYSPTFPDYALIDKEGVCRPPRYEFYGSKEGRSLVVLTGDSQPPLEDIPAHYEVCGDVLDFVAELGCKFIVTVGGAPSPRRTKEIFVAGTSRKHVEEYLGKDTTVYKGGRIVGAAGLLLGLAKKRGLRGVCLLGSTLGLTADREAASRLYRLLRRLLGTDI